MITGLVESCTPAQSGRSYSLTLNGGKRYTLSKKHFGTMVATIQPGVSVQFEAEAWTPPDAPDKVIWMAKPGTLKVQGSGTPLAAAQASFTADPGISKDSLIEALGRVLAASITAQGKDLSMDDWSMVTSYAKQALLHPDDPSKPVAAPVRDLTPDVFKGEPDDSYTDVPPY